MSQSVRFAQRDAAAPRRRGTPLALCAALWLVTAVAHAAPPQPILVCQNGVCWLDPAGYDSDGDGYSDADEKQAGTDPSDPKSHPYVMELLTGFLGGYLRSDEPAFREVIVLPTQAPDGSAIGAPELPSLEGRKSAMERLGLTDAKLDTLDLSNGVRVAIGTAGALREETSGVPMKVGGIDVRLISNLRSQHYEFDGGEGDVWVDENGNYMGFDQHWVDGDGVEHWMSCSSDGTCAHVEKQPFRCVMTDPDYWGGTLPTTHVRVATREEVEAYRKRVGTNTNFGPDGPRETPDSPPKVRDPYDPTIVLIDPSNDAVWLSTPDLDPDYDRFGGNVNTGRPDSPEKPPLNCPKGTQC